MKKYYTLIALFLLTASAKAQDISATVSDNTQEQFDQNGGGQHLPHPIADIPPIRPSPIVTNDNGLEGQRRKNGLYDSGRFYKPC